MQLGIQKNFLPLEHLSLEPLVFALLLVFLCFKNQKQNVRQSKT
jgi:hypothetical protein